MTIVPASPPAPTTACSGTIVTLTSTRATASVARRAASGTRNSWCPAARASRAARSAVDERRVEQPIERLAERIGARHAVEALERLVPADDAIVEADHEQPVVERFEDVLVEGAQAIELRRLDVELAIQPAVLDRGRRLAATADSSAMSSLVSGSPVSRRPSANTALRLSFETQGTR